MASAPAHSLPRLCPCPDRFRSGDLCWAKGPDAAHPEQLPSHFPDLELVFGPTASLSVDPTKYLFVNTIEPKSWCLGT